MIECDDFNQAREAARIKYKPERIRTLLITEAPSESNDRFFYFENVRKYDQLYISTMKVLYPHVHIKELRDRKASFLQMFKHDGFYLIDAIDSPFTQNDNNKRRTRIIWDNRHALIQKISSLASEETEIVLIKYTVYELRDYLKEEGYRVINRCPIESPGSCHNTEFNIKLKRLLEPSLEGHVRPYMETRNSNFVHG